jgi:large subunit ribosomal protein L24
MKSKLKIKKGDEVIVVTGKDTGKKGSVLKVLTKTSRLLVSGVNIATRHMRPSMTNAGGIVKKELPIHISNVAHIDPKSGEATKIGFKILESGKKVRFSKKSGEIIDK